MWLTTQKINEANLDVDNVSKGDTQKEKELKIKLDKEKDTDTLQETDNYLTR